MSGGNILCTGVDCCDPCEPKALNWKLNGTSVSKVQPGETVTAQIPVTVEEYRVYIRVKQWMKVQTT